MSPAEKQRRIKNYLRTLSRRARTVPARRQYLAHGGPWNEETIWLDPTPCGGRYAEWAGTATAPLRVGNWRGRYVEVTEDRWLQNNLVTRLPREVYGQVIWEELS